jgi:membrane protein DedA with SNARE-associated domain
MSKIAEILLGFQGPGVYAAVFAILLACGFGLPVPEDLTLIAAGFAAHLKAANVWAMIAVALAGVVVGDGTMFLLGKRFGARLTQKGPLKRLLPPARLERVTELVQTRGAKVLFAARFMPGLRSPLFFTAGSLGVPFKLFLLYDGAAALISVPAIVFSVYEFGEHLEEVVHVIKTVNYGIVAAIVVAGIAVALRWRRSKNLQPITRTVALAPDDENLIPRERNEAS